MDVFKKPIIVIKFESKLKKVKFKVKPFISNFKKI